MYKRFYKYGLIAALFLGGLVIQSCNSDDAEPVFDKDDKPIDEQIDDPVEPVINIKAAATITFPDPFPAQPWLFNGEKYFYSTRAQIMACNGLVNENCFTKVGSVTIDHGILQPFIDNGQISIIGYWAKSVYRDDSGNWHMVASPRIRNDNGQAWNVIAHLKPQKNEEWTTGNPIKSWIADEVLIGDPETFDYANYAGKFFQDNEGVLQLVYVRRIPGTSENGIFAQRMLSEQQIDQGYEPVELLAPGNFNSEYRNGTSGLKLLETGNIAKVEGKYVIAYTVGDYVDDNYKLGIAWSDDLQGPYKKVLKEDIENVWRNGSNAPEVQYLLQAQHKDWPNYIKNQVKAPGVPIY